MTRSPQESCCITVSDWHLPGVRSLTSPVLGKMSSLFGFCPEPRPHREGALAPLSQGQTHAGGWGRLPGRHLEGMAEGGQVNRWALSPLLGVAWRCLSALPNSVPTAGWAPPSRCTQAPRPSAEQCTGQLPCPPGQGSNTGPSIQASPGKVSCLELNS